MATGESSYDVKVFVMNNQDESVIDLTDDEPPAKKALIHTSHTAKITENISSSTCVSKELLTSESNPLVECSINQDGCYTCGDSKSVIVYLKCKHRFCYKHFVLNLQQTKTTENFCFTHGCNQRISDKMIRDALTQSDYVSFLELTRDNLRTAIQLQNSEVICIESQSRSQSLSPPHNTLEETLAEKVSEHNQIGDLNTEHINGHQSEFLNLQNLDTMRFIKNVEPFQCPICFVDYGPQEGVILKNCLHSFCRECISATIQHSDEPRVICPFQSDNGPCQFFIQDREIRGLISPEIYELHLQKGLTRAETNLDNVYHCKTPDCVGFIQYETAVKAYPCPVCDKVNCVKCMAIHEEKTCEGYQFDLKNDAKNQEELKMTEQSIQKMIRQGKAMQCPKCNILIQKDDGCDYVECGSCKLGICYRTKKPRYSLQKLIDGFSIVIDGCHCNENGRLCHRKCGGCH